MYGNFSVGIINIFRLRKDSVIKSFTETFTDLYFIAGAISRLLLFAINGKVIISLQSLDEN